jgi:hypothetical protein
LKQVLASPSFTSADVGSAVMSHCPGETGGFEEGILPEATDAGGCWFGGSGGGAAHVDPLFAIITVLGVPVFLI